LTSITGFLFPGDSILLSHVVGVISLAILAVAVFARYPRQLAGNWRWIYVVGAMTALYLNVFVAVVQLFLKSPAFNALAPTQSEAPFVAAQAIVLATFVWIIARSARSFHPAPGVPSAISKFVNRQRKDL
jgi:uncharacterized membrane protein YdcZ (DUF606 family)